MVKLKVCVYFSCGRVKYPEWKNCMTDWATHIVQTEDVKLIGKVTMHEVRLIKFYE